MFEAVHNNKRLAQAILAILVIPFAFFGLEGYFRDGPEGSELARIGDVSIRQNEFDRALRQQQDRLRREMAANLGRIDQDMLNSEALRRAVLDNLVIRRMFMRYASDMRIAVSPEQLRQEIAKNPAFHEDGKFSLTRYENLLAKQEPPLTPVMFETQTAQELRFEQLMSAVDRTALVASASARRILAAQIEGRTVSELRFPVAAHLAGLKIDEAHIRKYYDDNGSRFERPERVKVEYVVFDQAGLQSRIEVSEEEIRKTYKAEIKRYTTPEERRVRHILIEVAADADETAVENARKQIEEIAARLKDAPARFAEFAKQHSQDRGTKAEGGDLGYITRQQMLQAFEDAAFSQEKNVIGGPVRTDYGFHLIQVLDIRPEKSRPYSAVRGEIAAELRRQATGQRFAELAGKFSDIVFEQSDSLAPAADELGLTVQKTGWIDRTSGEIGTHRNPELIEAVFSSDAIESRQNTRAIEIGVNALLAARVVEHEAAQRLPFETVRDAIEEQLRGDEARRLAREAGAAALEKLEKGESVAGKWSAARTVQRASSQLPSPATQAVFSAPTAKLPNWVGVEVPGEAYVVYRIDAVERPPIDDDDPRLAIIASQYAELSGEHEWSAFLATLHTRYQVKFFPPTQTKE
jgi:peptidyl-prolyl cis-trans isomerase D